jgi:hypothetical protein
VWIVSIVNFVNSSDCQALVYSWRGAAAITIAFKEFRSCRSSEVTEYGDSLFPSKIA